MKPITNSSENRIFVGNPVMIEIDNKNYIGEVKWMGIITNKNCVGLDMVIFILILFYDFMIFQEDQFEYGIDGIIRTDNIFDCRRGHGLITPLTNIKLCK